MKQNSFRLMKVATILALLTTACSPPAASTAQTSAPQTPAPTADVLSPGVTTNGLVDVGGRKLMLHCSGQGSPTVILEAGSGSHSTSWIQVQSGSDPGYRVCSYDRANLGDSDPAPTPRTFLDMAHDLHALLANAAIDGPYILVGHSGGGMIIRVYREQYPEGVAGMVLVDAGHPDMGERLLAGLPEKSPFEPKALRQWRIWLSWMTDSQGSLYKDAEGMDSKQGMAQVKAASPLGDLPLVVVSRSPDNTTMEGRLPLSPEANAKLRQIWQDMQSELAGLSSNSTHVISSHSGHMIPTEEPELVIEAIRKLVNEARSRMGVTGSPAPPADPTQAVHVPKILRVVAWQEKQNGRLILHNDIYFTDAAGDAAFCRGRLVSADPPGDWSFSPDGFVTTSAEEQRREGLIPNSIACGPQATFVFEKWLVDQAGNVSEPVRYTYACPAPERGISSFLIIGLVTGLGLLATATWLLIRHRRTSQAAVSRV